MRKANHKTYRKAKRHHKKHFSFVQALRHFAEALAGI